MKINTACKFFISVFNFFDINMKINTLFLFLTIVCCKLDMVNKIDENQLGKNSAQELKSVSENVLKNLPDEKNT